MTFELGAAILFAVITVLALIFSLFKVFRIEPDSFPNRGRYFAGLWLWVLSSFLLVLMTLPGYDRWFVPAAYPVIKISFLALFLIGLFAVVTTIIAFPIHMSFHRREIDSRSDRIALLESIRQIAMQPYPLTETFSLALRELASFLVIPKGAVFLVNPSRREMYLVAQIGLDKNELSRLERFPIGQDIISRAASEQAPFLSGDLTASDFATRKLLLAGRDIKLSAAAVPLSCRDRSLGTLLIIPDKPHRFEKDERMLLNSIAETLAGVVETSRLSRENQKLLARIGDNQAVFEGYRQNLGLSARIDGQKEALSAICRYIGERYGAVVTRIVKLVNGELEDVARFEISAELNNQIESYRTAIIDAIMRHKMVILNQEAKRSGGSPQIIRSTLLCPISIGLPGEYVLLAEYSGGGLNLTEAAMSDIEMMIHLASINLTTAGLKEAEDINQIAIRSLLNILKIKADASEALVFRQFLDEAGRIVQNTTSVVVFTRDRKNGYRLLDSCHVAADVLTESFFMPGEGPVGKTAITGDPLEFTGSAKIEEAWNDLEPANQDFFSRLFGEKGTPIYQLNIPVRVMEETVAVGSVFSHGVSPRQDRREKGILLLAVQLLSIKLSMTRMNSKLFEDLGHEKLNRVAHILNLINNDLATVLGRAELLGRQPDAAGPARYTANEIVKAADSAAESIKRHQESLKPQEEPPASSTEDSWEKLERYLESRRVTGNLYMFEHGRPVMLHIEKTESSAFPAGEGIYQIIETVLKNFVAMIEEGEEVFLTSQVRDNDFFISLMRGSRDKHRQFDPFAHDYGDPDVLPPDIADSDMVSLLTHLKGRVSFDRFGRRPTYLSFRFDLSAPSPALLEPETPTGNLAGLKLLAVDDQQMILDLLSGICLSLGLRLTAVRDAQKALEMIRENRYDIVLTDLVMDSEVSGWDIARETKQHWPDTPVVMMTGWGLDVSSNDLSLAGIDFTLTKPFRIEQLIEIVNKARLKHTSF